MKNIYKNRLLLLASFLENLPEGRFNYGHWVGKDWQGKQDFSCGTTACALGWATAIPELADAGLIMVKGENIGRNGGVVCLRSEAKKEGFVLNYYHANKAAEHVFDLNEDEFNFLFIPDSEENTMYGRRMPNERASAKEVAAHIRFFVDQKYN